MCDKRNLIATCASGSRQNSIRPPISRLRDPPKTSVKPAAIAVIRATEPGTDMFDAGSL